MACPPFISLAGEQHQPKPCESSEMTPAPWLLAWYASGGFPNSPSSVFRPTMEAVQKVVACLEPATAATTTATATAAGRSLSGDGSTPSPGDGLKPPPVEDYPTVKAYLAGYGSKASPAQGSPMVEASLAGDGVSASPCEGGPVEMALRAAGGAAQVRDGCYDTGVHLLFF